MKLFIWTDECNYTAFAHCDTVAEARDLLRPQIGGYDGSCPERAKARKSVEEFTPAVYNGRVADFRLSASAEEREATEYADKLSLQVTDLRAQLKASQQTALDYHRRWQEAEAKMVSMEETRNTAMRAEGEAKADVKLLREALQEAACWLPDGTRTTPRDRGAKCETFSEAREIISIALAATAPKGEQVCQSKN